MNDPCPSTSGRGSVPTGGLCLNASRWDALHTFCAATNAKLVFGLSYPQLGEHNHLCPNGCKNTSGRWNASQAKALFEYSKTKGYSPVR